jgi:hypothetical protein
VLVKLIVVVFFNGFFVGYGIVSFIKDMVLLWKNR